MKFVQQILDFWGDFRLQLFENCMLKLFSLSHHHAPYSVRPWIPQHSPEVIE